MINFRSLFIQIPEKKISTSKTFQNTLPRLIFFGTKLCLILAKKHKENVNKDLIGSRELKCQSKWCNFKLLESNITENINNYQKKEIW